MSKAAELLVQARQLADASTTWADFFNALFDPLEGLLALAYPIVEERRAFLQTPECQQIQQLMTDVVKRHGLLEGAHPTKITEFMVQCHWTLSPEAQEGSRFTVHSRRGNNPPTGTALDDGVRTNTVQ